MAKNQLLHRHMFGALEQMGPDPHSWTVRARRENDEETRALRDALSTLSNNQTLSVDPYLAAERWLKIITLGRAQRRPKTLRPALFTCAI